MIETERLTLAPFSRTDVPDLFAIRGDPQAMAFWDWPPDASLDDTHRAADSMVAAVEREEAIYWTARCKHDNSFVGIFDLSDLFYDAADLGFMIVRRLEGQGYAYEAASRLIAEARKRQPARLKARIHAGNVRSQRLLELLGFTRSSEHDFEIRPGMTVRCAYFWLNL